MKSSFHSSVFIMASKIWRAASDALLRIIVVRRLRSAWGCASVANGGQDATGVAVVLHIQGRQAGEEQGQVRARTLRVRGVQWVNDDGPQIPPRVAHPDDPAALFRLVRVGTDNEKYRRPALDCLSGVRQVCRPGVGLGLVFSALRLDDDDQCRGVGRPVSDTTTESAVNSAGTTAFRLVGPRVAFAFEGSCRPVMARTRSTATSGHCRINSSGAHG